MSAHRGNPEILGGQARNSSGCSGKLPEKIYLAVIASVALTFDFAFAHQAVEPGTGLALIDWDQPGEGLRNGQPRVGPQFRLASTRRALTPCGALMTL